MAHSLNPNYFETSPSNGISFIGLHHPIIYKVMAKLKIHEKIFANSWHGCSLDKDKLCCALLQYRNTPSHKDTLSPAQKLYGRPAQDTIPAHR